MDYPEFTQLLLDTLQDEFDVTVGGIDKKGRVINNEEGFSLRNQKCNELMQCGIQCALDLLFSVYPEEDFNVRWKDQGLPEETAFITCCI